MSCDVITLSPHPNPELRIITANAYDLCSRKKGKFSDSRKAEKIPLSFKDQLSVELDEYFKIDIQDDALNFKEFYSIYNEKFPRVLAAAKRGLLTPATSGPIGRV
jgi:hypothetical protein